MENIGEIKKKGNCGMENGKILVVLLKKKSQI
jgi:hypothetical protein